MYNYNNFKHIYPGYGFVIAQDLDGYIYGSGLNDECQFGYEMELPIERSFIQLPNVSDIKDIACGPSHTVILKNDGTVWGCGNNYQFQLAYTNPVYEPCLKQIPNMTNVKQIACGSSTTLILKDDGLWGAGIVDYLGTTYSKSNTIGEFIKLYDMTDIKQIVCGSEHVVILKNDGTLLVGGQNAYGQLGTGDTTKRNSFVQVPNMTDVKCVFSKYYSTFAIKNDGTVWACGNNTSGQFGLNNKTNQTTFVQLSVNNAKKVVCGHAHAIILKNDGTLWSSGGNSYGQLGQGDNKSRTTYAQIQNISGVKQIYNGFQHTFAIKNDGTIWACGLNNYGQLGTGDTINKNAFVQIPNMANIKLINGGFFTIILKNDGTVWGCGNNWNGQLFGIKYYNKYREFKKIYNEPVKKVWLNQEAYNTYILKNDNTLHVAGPNWYGQTGVGNNDYDHIIQFTQIMDNVKDISYSDYIIAILKNDNTLWWAGSTDYNNADPIWTPVQLASDVKKVVVGDAWILFIKNDNTLWGFGYNKGCIFGLGHENYVSTPVQIADNVKDIAMEFYAYHTVILKNDGTVWGCGYNAYGQLGLGHKNTATTFTKITDNAKEVKIGSSELFIIKNDNTLWTSGYNNGYLLGINDGHPITTLTKSLDNIDRIYNFYINAFAIKKDGTIWACGLNNYGELGTGSDYRQAHIWTQLDLPINGLDIKDIQLCDENSFIIMNDGSAYFCGSNNHGANGCHISITEKNHMTTTFTKYEIPNSFGEYSTKINNEIVNVKHGSGGNTHEALMDETNCIFVKGDNDFGQLGLSDVIDRDDYTKLNIDDIKYIKAARNITIIKKADGTLHVVGEHIGKYFTEYKFKS